MSSRKKAPRAGNQVEAFKKAARVADCDLSEAAFDRALGKIGKAKPEPQPSKKRKAKSGQ